MHRPVAVLITTAFSLNIVAILCIFRMDPLSISASVAGLIGLIQTLLGYLSDATSLSKEVRALEDELTGLSAVMQSLESVSGSLQLRAEDTSGKPELL